MSTLADRLRDVLRPRAQSAPEDAPAAHERACAADAAEILGGEWRDARGRRFLIVERKYPPGYRHGRVTLADCLPPDGGIWPRLPLLMGGTNLSAAFGAEGGGPPGKLLFVDLETTGLAGGAGTYAFLVGCGWFDGGVFRVRQFLLSDFGAERALLEALADIAAETACVVTFNGKSFDLPIIETRFVLQRMETPFADMPHVDMLHPARRLWREDDIECRLTFLERALCHHEREGDVQGFEIPGRYFRYVRSGDARPLEAVLEHNRLDIVSLAMVTARAAHMLDAGPDAASTAREACGMGRLYERAGMTDEALHCFWRAAQAGDGESTRTEALRAYAILCRRLRRYDDAADAWEQLIDLRRCPPALAREATEALAVHHEHRVRDLSTARTFALRSLQLQVTAARQDAVRYRLARLERKIGARPVSIEAPEQQLFPLAP